MLLQEIPHLSTMFIRLNTTSHGIIALSLVLSGCQAAMYGTADDLNRLQLGMSQAQVISVMGEPMTRSADSGSGEEKLTYKRMAYTLGWSPTFYDIVLKNGKVIRFGAQP